MRTPLLLLCLAAGLAIIVAIANPNVHSATSAPAKAAAMPAVASAQSDTDSAAGQLVLHHCGVCHGLEVLSQNPQDADDWRQTVALMQQMGAQVSDQEASQIVDYLARHFPAH